jgi:hypothetical protein
LAAHQFEEEAKLRSVSVLLLLLINLEEIK